MSYVFVRFCIDKPWSLFSYLVVRQLRFLPSIVITSARAIFCGDSINKKRPIFVVRNGYRALLTTALMPIKAVHYPVFCNNFTRHYSSLFTHETSKERHSTHTPYADTSALQILWVDSALRLELTKGTCIQRRTYFPCSIVCLDICL